MTRSIYERTDTLFRMRAAANDANQARVLLAMPGMDDIPITDWMPINQARLMFFALRTRVTQFATAQRRSKAKLAEVVAMESRR